MQLLSYPQQSRKCDFLFHSNQNILSEKTDDFSFSSSVGSVEYLNNSSSENSGKLSAQVHKNMTHTRSLFYAFSEILDQHFSNTARKLYISQSFTKQSTCNCSHLSFQIRKNWKYAVNKTPLDMLPFYHIDRV